MPLTCSLCQVIAHLVVIVINRLKREEIKIQAWENHLKAKTEAELRKVEVLSTFYDTEMFTSNIQLCVL